jgi:exonuclease SbcD
MTDRLRVAHCSDIHLTGETSDRARNGFGAALAAIRAQRPDLLLLAGDLFDSNAVPDRTILWAMAELGALPFPVVMIPGNHDCLIADGIYRRHDFDTIGNVRLIADPAGGAVDLPALGARVWGRAMVSHTPGFQPLAGLEARPADRIWHLGLAHGFFVPRGEESMRSSPIRMEEIEAAGLDYLALGHHHAAMELVTPRACAAYCGSPTDTLGRGRTYALADLVSGRTPTLTIHRID